MFTRSAKADTNLTRFLTCVVALSLGIAPSTGWGQEGPIPLLKSAFEEAWNRSPVAVSLSSRQVESKVAITTADSWVAGSPILGLNQRVDQSSGAADVGYKESEISITSPVWWPAQKSARQAVAGSAAEELDAEISQYRLELAGKVRELYWQVAIALQDVREVEDHVEHLSDIAKDVQRRAQAGDLARSDELLANQEFEFAQSQLTSSRIELQRRKAEYQNVTGLPAPTVFQVESIGSPADRHPRIRLAQSSLAKAQAALLLANESRASTPTVGLSMRNESSDTNPRSQALGFHVQIPIGTDVLVKPLQAEAQTNLSKLQAELKVAEQTLINEIEFAKSQLSLEEKGLSQLTRRASLASEHLQLIRKAFQWGDKALIDLIRAQVLSHEATIAQSKQQLKVNMAISRMNQSIGVLP